VDHLENYFQTFHIHFQLWEQVMENSLHFHLLLLNELVILDADSPTSQGLQRLRLVVVLHDCVYSYSKISNIKSSLLWWFTSLQGFV
jgi:hypothetical protein